MNELAIVRSVYDITYAAGYGYNAALDCVRIRIMSYGKRIGVMENLYSALSLELSLSRLNT